MSASFALQSQGSAPKNMSLGSTPVFGAFPGYTPSANVNSTPAPQNTAPKIGTNPGLINPVPKTAIKSTSVAHPDGTTVTNTFHPETVKAPDDPSNKYNTATGALNSKYVDPDASTVPTTPQVGTTSQNAQTVLNSGNQTQNEQQTQAGLLAAGQKSPDQQAALNAVEYGLGVQNNKNFGQYAEAGMLGTDPQAYVNQANAPDLAGRASAEQGLAGQYTNLYGTQANAALNEANTIAGQGLSAAGSAYSGAQNQASRETGAAGTVLNASIPGQISGSARTYNPLDPAGTTGTSGIITGANNQSISDLSTQYNNGLKTLTQASGIENQIANTLVSNPEINNQPLSLLTNLNQYLSGQLGTAPQQLLAQQVNSYIQTLGLDPASVVDIATQQKGTLKQLLSSLKDTATSNNNAIKTTRDNLVNTPSTSGGFANGQTSADGSLIYQNGKWVKA